MSHIRDVHDVDHIVAGDLEKAPQKVAEEKGSEVSNVGVVVDRRAAAVHPNGSGLHGLEIFNGIGK